MVDNKLQKQGKSGQEFDFLDGQGTRLVDFPPFVAAITGGKSNHGLVMVEN